MDCNQSLKYSNTIKENSLKDIICLFDLYNESKCNTITGANFTAGGGLVGEPFGSSYDCSKILDSNPEAKDGMYWINLGGDQPKQVRNIII